MTEHEDADTLRAVCQEAHALLGKVGGPVRRIAVRAGEHQVEIEWDPGAAPPAMVPVSGVAVTTVAVAVEGGDGAAAGRHVVTAPLVGTFYRSPEPGAKAFIEVGDVVEAEQEIAIIEAMKIMNRIVADAPGRVAEILVTDGDMVEYGQPLVYLEPLDENG